MNKRLFKIGEGIKKLCVLIIVLALIEVTCVVKVEAAEQEISAAELVEDIKVGWNLGNSLNCCDNKSTVDDNSVKRYETLWGNPQTTRNMIQKVKEAGFNAIRIPVTYYNHIDAEGAIDRKWLNRVAEVVQYGLGEGMYVIINVHHDTGNGKNKPIQADLTNIAMYQSYVKNVWEQVATYFKEYDSKLIFEGMNETLDMSALNPWYGEESSWEAMNVLNQAFVDVVRATGGKNVTRNLIVNTYGAQITSGPLEHFRLPLDSVSSHLIVGVHTFYSDEKSIGNFMGNLYQKFVVQGVPVIISEFGTPCWDDINNRTASAIHFMNYGNMYGIKCFWWDDGGNYRLLDRKKNNWQYLSIVNGIMEAVSLMDK